MTFTRENVITIAVIGFLLLAVGLYTFYSVKIANPKEQSAASSALSLSESEGNSYTTLDGELVDLAQYDGRVRVVNSWASWCPFCVNELPDFAKLANEYSVDEVVVLAINRKEQSSLARRYIDTLTDVKGVIFILDPSDSFYSKIGGFSMPETIFYDKEGNISFHKRGFMSLEEMKKHTNKALEDSSKN